MKIGMFNSDRWAAYLLNGDVFIKRTDADPTKACPDLGCSFEMFTNARVPGSRDTRSDDERPTGTEYRTHRALGLFRNASISQLADEEIERTVIPFVARVAERALGQ
jgi:hypothetical protein